MCTTTCPFSYATDEAYIGLTSISIASLLTHNQGATIILLADHVKAESLDKLRAMVQRLRGTLQVINVSAELWYSPEDYAEARREPIVYHFLGNTLGRPWYRESKNPLRPLYRKYAEMAGLGEFCNKSRPLERYYLLQWLLWKLLPNALFVEACRLMYRLFFKLRYKV